MSLDDDGSNMSLPWASVLFRGKSRGGFGFGVSLSSVKFSPTRVNVNV